MIEVLVLNGSPRHKGNTATLTRRLREQLGRDAFKTIEIFLYDLNLKPCIDCRACKKGRQVCVIDDDMQPLYRQMSKADLLVIATPIYWFGPTAPCKLMLDRCRPFFVNQGLQGHRAVLLMTAGSGEKDTDLTFQMFARSFDALGINFLESVHSEAYDYGDAAKDSEAMQHISTLAQTLRTVF